RDRANPAEAEGQRLQSDGADGRRAREAADQPRADADHSPDRAARQGIRIAAGTNQREGSPTRSPGRARQAEIFDGQGGRVTGGQTAPQDGFGSGRVRRLLQGVTTLWSRAGESVHLLPVLGLRRRRTLPTRKEVRLLDARTEPGAVSRGYLALPVLGSPRCRQGTARIQRMARLRPGYP